MYESLAQSARSRRLSLAALFLAAGGLALTVQVTLLRELLVALQGDETAIGLGLAAWLLGISAGAWLSRRLLGSRPEYWAVLGFALLALAGPLEVVAGRWGRVALAPAPGELLAIGPAVLLALIGLAPAGALVGLTFTALATTAPAAGWKSGQGIARLFVLESLGSLVGGLAVTFITIPFLEPLAGILLASAGWICIGSPAAWKRIVPGRAVLTVLALVLLLAAVTPFADALEQATIKSRFSGLAPGIPLLDWSETPYQHLAIGGEQLHHLYAGGQYSGTFPDPAEHEALAHRLACLAPKPRNLLLIGGGPLGPLRHLLKHPFERIDLVEIDRQALEFIKRYLPAEELQALRDPRVNLVIDDPRRFLSRESAGYDLILILKPAPVTLLLARFSTVQFYRLCAARLSSTGVLVVKLETAPNLLTGETAALGGSVYGALAAVFPVVHAVPGPDGLLIAGTDPQAVTLDPQILAERFKRREIQSAVFVPELFPILFPPERVAGQESALIEAAGHFPASSDVRPVSFLHALALRQQLAESSFAPLFGLAARVSPWWLVLLALSPSLLMTFRVVLAGDSHESLCRAAVHTVTVTGCCGMACALLILFSFQTTAGALYGRIGLLTALVMLGLALGARLFWHQAELRAAEARRWLAAVTTAFLCFTLLLPVTLQGLASSRLSMPLLPELLHGLLLLVTGLLVGALFPVAAGALLALQRGTRDTAASLEAADHFGAAIAALVGTTIFIPALGLAGTAWILAGLLAIALLGVGLAGPRKGRIAE